MTVEAHQWRNTLRWSTNSDFFQNFGQQWALSPKDISCYLVPGFTPSAARFIHNNIISKEVCRVFVLQCHSALPFCLFCLVSSSSSVICNCTVVQSSTVHTVIQITFIHAFIQLYIHTLIPSHINAYTTYKQYQSIHGCISHPNFVSIVSLQFDLYLSSCHAPGSHKRIARKSSFFHQKCHPQCVWSRDVTNQSF